MTETNARQAGPAEWAILAGPPNETTAAVTSAGRGRAAVLYAGARGGVYRASAAGSQAVNWERLAEAPGEIVSLAASPLFAEDHTILAGAGDGLYISRDGGDHWQRAATPMPNSLILAICFSPAYAGDGAILLGTLEDGICYSDTRGETWTYRGFGLLDATVYSLALSPRFATDATVFAGAETALYYSYNGARAWKQLDFPDEATPILSLALLPQAGGGEALFVGTETQGLYRGRGLGRAWERLALPATSVNALLALPENGGLLAATGDGLFHSHDEGDSWTCLLDCPDVLSVAALDGIIVAGQALSNTT